MNQKIKKILKSGLNSFLLSLLVLVIIFFLSGRTTGGEYTAGYLITFILSLILFFVGIYFKDKLDFELISVIILAVKGFMAGVGLFLLLLFFLNISKIHFSIASNVVVDIFFKLIIVCVSIYSVKIIPKLKKNKLQMSALIVLIIFVLVSSFVTINFNVYILIILGILAFISSIIMLLFIEFNFLKRVW